MEIYLTEFAFVPRPGAAHMGMTTAHGNLPDIMLQKFASAPRPGAARMAMTMVHGALLTSDSQRV
eukprot:9050808-Karenia_brevis.AAC.1